MLLFYRYLALEHLTKKVTIAFNLQMDLQIIDKARLQVRK